MKIYAHHEIVLKIIDDSVPGPLEMVDPERARDEEVVDLLRAAVEYVRKTGREETLGVFGDLY